MQKPKSYPAGDMAAESKQRLDGLMDRVRSPSISLLCKLGSIIVHIDEGASKDGHHFDVIAMRTLMADPEVKAWLADMGAASLLPVKRSAPPSPSETK